MRRDAGRIDAARADHVDAELLLEPVDLALRNAEETEHAARAHQVREVVVSTILNDTALKAAWRVELAEMRGRLREMRVLLNDALKEKAPERDFSHLVRARGMFCFLGIPESQVNRLKKEYGVYMVGSSRINTAGITAQNVDYLADAIAATL